SVVLDRDVAAVLLPVHADGAHAVRADRNHFFHAGLADLFQISLRQFAEQIIVAQAACGIASALLLAQNAEADAQVTQQLDQGQQNLPSVRIKRSQASHPQAVFLGSVEVRQAVLLDELFPIRRRKSKRVPLALERDEHFAAMTVVPLAGIYRAAPQTHDQRQVLDAHRALELAGPARSALESRFHGKVFAQQQFAALRPELLQVMPGAQNDFFGI